MISGVQADAFVEAQGAVGRLDIRKAVMRDIPPILDLINSYAARASCCRALSSRCRGHPRLHGSDAGHIAIGLRSAALLQPTVAEIRSLAVAGHAKTQGVGRKLVSALISEAQRSSWTLYSPSPMWNSSSRRWGLKWWSAARCR